MGRVRSVLIYWLEEMGIGSQGAEVCSLLAVDGNGGF